MQKTDEMLERVFASKYTPKSETKRVMKEIFDVSSLYC